MKIFLNTTDLSNPKIEITTTKQDLLKQLKDEWNSPFEHIGKDEMIWETKGEKKEIFAVWLDDCDSKKEPTTPRGMLKRLGLLEKWKHLLNNKDVTFCIDDRALIINI